MSDTKGDREQTGCGPDFQQATTSGRGEGRPVRRRTRTFRPNYLSFAGTYQCTLSLLY
jgi:hypothetical protein